MSTGNQEDCPNCDGDGQVLVENDDLGELDYWDVCPVCNGDGYIVEWD